MQITTQQIRDLFTRKRDEMIRRTDVHRTPTIDVEFKFVLVPKITGGR